jgi:hypothetical protein
MIIGGLEAAAHTLPVLTMHLVLKLFIYMYLLVQVQQVVGAFPRKKGAGLIVDTHTLS